jgi:hypothetical protein
MDLQPDKNDYQTRPWNQDNNAEDQVFYNQEIGVLPDTRLIKPETHDLIDSHPLHPSVRAHPLDYHHRTRGMERPPDVE